MKKIAIPVSNDLLDRHFGHCQVFSVYNVEDDKIVGEEKHVPPPHEPGLLPKWLHERGVEVVLAGGMGNRAVELFGKVGIEVVTGVEPDTVENLAAAFVAGELRTGANVCDH